MRRNLAVILGAGSSYDCVTGNVTDVDTDYRPPLTRDLFAFRASFNTILRKYPKAEALSDEIRTQVAAGTSVETLLRSLEGNPNEFVKRQYYAIPLYLQELLGEVSAHYVRAGPTKFDTLVRALESSSYDKILYLTLNYDLFLEKALRRLYLINLSVPRHYVGGNFKWSLIKLHGSVNWGRKLMNPAGAKNSSEILDYLAGELVLDSDVRVLNGWQEEARLIDNSYYYPAITVPLEGKDEFICPKEHSDHAKEFLHDCTDFLVIGFSALDGHVLKLLEVVPRVEKLTIVNEGRDSAIETLDRLVQVNNNFAPFPAGKESVASDVGFARFIDDGRLLSFLAT
jgi:hypothetical protein